MIADGVKPDRHVYNILLDDCAQRGRFEDVASIIKDMRIRGLPPLAEAYTTVITALAKRGDPVTAEAFYKKALREGVKPDRQMIASLMTAHSEVGSWKGVIRVFDYLTSSDDRHLRPRIDIYNILLNAYVLAGSPFEIVSDVFQKMEQSGIRPTVHTFSILIKSACDSGEMDIAMRVFVELDSLAESWKTGFTMNVYALTILMAGYLRQGDQSKAKEIYDEMLFRGIAPTSVTYNSILRAYISEGSQESIQLACDFMKSLMESPDQPPKWLSAYSRFSGFENIYSPLMTLFARNAKAEHGQGRGRAHSGDPDATAQRLPECG
jgi:pentatricopeptide repeat protein